MSQPSQGPIFTHGGWDVYAGLIFLVLPVALAALLHKPSTYREAGLRKMPWALAAAVCTVTCTGPFFAAFYLMKARPKFKALKRARQPRDSGWSGGGGYETEPYRGTSGRFEGVKRQICAGCHGRGTENCYQCTGGMVSDGHGGMIRHNACNMGTKTCSSCRGSGYAN